MLKSIEHAELGSKVVLCRFDFNVPIVDGEIMDDTRIRRALSTIEYLLNKDAKIIITSHLGRPNGVIIPSLSLKPVALYLEKLLDEPVTFVDKIIGPEVRKAVGGLRLGLVNIVVLENTRFDKREKSNDPEFAKELAELADIYVSDAFGTVHRAHASTVGVANYLPSYAGLLVNEEFTKITEAMKNPIKPTVAIIGGAKVSTKLDVINNLMDIADTIIIGGGMVFTFLLAQDKEIGKSLVELAMIDTASELIDKAKEEGVNLIIPSDIRIGKDLRTPILDGREAKIVSNDKIPLDAMGLDIGIDAENDIVDIISEANTIFWNGPMGVFENELYRSGTEKIVKALLDRNVTTIIGGGDSVYALNMLTKEAIPQNIHVSTGGGASMELLSGLDLPGIECLKS
jgi:phosphoglycerate kinase